MSNIKEKVFEKLDKYIHKLAEEQFHFASFEYYEKLNDMLDIEFMLHPDYKKYITGELITKSYKTYNVYRKEHLKNIQKREIDYVKSLATSNKAELTNDKFNDIIYKNFNYDETLLNRLDELFNIYIVTRNKFIEKSERKLIGVINSGKRAENKPFKKGLSILQLFNLIPFKDYSEIVDKTKIWNHYIMKYPPSEHQQQPKTTHEQINFKPILEFIYNELIKTRHEFLNPNEFLHFLIKHKETENVSSYYKTLYTQYKNNYYKSIRNKPTIPIITDSFSLNYPFKSKYKDYKNNIENGLFLKSTKFTDEKKDPQAKRLKDSLSRPSFSPYPYSWEIDHLQYDKNHITYLFCLNINTRYLYVIPVDGKGEYETKIALRTLIENERKLFNHPIKNIRGDGDSSFETIAKQKTFPDINFYFSSSPFTYHNKLIDASMRTLRNALNDDRLWDGHHDNIIQDLVKFYNYTTHRVTGYKPIEIHSNIDLEWEYIRKKKEELNEVKKLQYYEGLYNYKPGDKLKIHLEYSKTNQMFDKRRRQFDVIATFIEYVCGNCRVLPEGKTKYIDVPIYFTRRVYDT